MTRLARPPRWLAGLLGAAALQLAAPALHAAPVQWTVAAGGNGHWYDYVPTISIFAPIGFDAARAAALGSSHQGLQGYLATVTSAQEQAFIQSSFPFLLGFGATGSAWLGASDAAVEGDWRWLDGPEAGQSVTYTNWLLGQPVNAPGFEDHDLLALNINAVVANAPVVYGWTSLTPQNGTFGYVVEYGLTPNGPDDPDDPTDPNPVPEPSGALMAATALLLAGLQRRRRRR